MSAAQRHRILLAPFVMLLLCPFFPRIGWSFWSDTAADGSITTRQTFSSVASTSNHTALILATIWLAGAVLSLLAALLNLVRLRRTIRDARPSSERDTPVEVLISPDPVMPLTFGIWNSRILLPAASLHWTPSRKRAVLLHELAHIKRRDVASQWLVALVTALWWFQPLCWITRKRLRAESELACDAAVIVAGTAPSLYASELLDIAQSFQLDQRWSAAAITMATQGEIASRITALLETPQPGMPRKLFSSAFVLLMAVALSASALTITRQDVPGGLFMKRSLFTGMLAVATLAGTQVIAAPAPAQTTSSAKSPEPVRVPGEKEQANIITKVQPVYPASAKAAKVQGEVLLDAVITKEGIPTELKVVKSPSEDLTDSAIDAVRQWRYRPVLLNGEPIDVATEIRVNYTLLK